MSQSKERIEAIGYAFIPPQLKTPALIELAVAMSSGGGDVGVQFGCEDEGTRFTVYLSPADWQKIADAAQNVYRPPFFPE